MDLWPGSHAGARARRGPPEPRSGAGGPRRGRAPQLARVHRLHARRVRAGGHAGPPEPGILFARASVHVAALRSDRRDHCRGLRGRRLSAALRDHADGSPGPAVSGDGGGGRPLVRRSDLPVRGRGVLGSGQGAAVRRGRIRRRAVRDSLHARHDRHAQGSGAVARQSAPYGAGHGAGAIARPGGGSELSAALPHLRALSCAAHRDLLGIRAGPPGSLRCAGGA